MNHIPVEFYRPFSNFLNLKKILQCTIWAYVLKSSKFFRSLKQGKNEDVNI